MARYLIVAYQTAERPELIEEIRAIAAREPDAEFVLLVPATPVSHLLTWEEGESRVVARRRAETARSAMESVGARVIDARVGDESPLQAIDDELRDHPGYSAVIVSTLPARLSRWLKVFDLPARVRQRFTLPVIHVEVDEGAGKRVA